MCYVPPFVDFFGPTTIQFQTRLMPLSYSAFKNLIQNAVYARYQSHQDLRQRHNMLITNTLDPHVLAISLVAWNGLPPLLPRLLLIHSIIV